MADKTSNPAKDTPSREDRLAAKLRENLRRRKTQARDLADGAVTDDPGALPKPQQKS